MTRRILASILLSLTLLATAQAQDDPYYFYPCYLRYTNNGDTTTPFHVICPVGYSYNICYVYEFIDGMHVRAFHSNQFEFRSTPGQQPAAENEWCGNPWTLIVNGMSDNNGWIWTLTNSGGYGFGDYTTVSCVDQNGNPVNAPAGTWTLILGTPGDEQDVPATATMAHSASTAGDTLDPRRTTIGIGEQVQCWVANWLDPDWNANMKDYVFDNVGLVSWAASNEHTILPVPPTGSSITFTAPLLTMADGNQNVTITITAHDAGATRSSFAA